MYISLFLVEIQLIVHMQCDYLSIQEKWKPWVDLNLLFLDDL